MAANWMKRLARPSAVLARLPSGRGGYGVYSGSDRRRRPSASIDQGAFQQALSDGLLEAGEGGYVLSAEGRGRLDRLTLASDQPFADQHRKPTARQIMETDGPRTVRASAEAGPLARYLKPAGDRPALLEPVHASAAAIFVRDYERSALTSRLTADWSSPPGGKHRSAPVDRAHAPVSRLDAQARVLAALEAVGSGLDRLLFAVLVRETGMGQTERDQGWPERSGATLLKLALDRLAVHYRLKVAPDPERVLNA